MLKKILFTLFLAAPFFVSLNYVSAHGTGVSLDKQVENYTVEFEYDDPEVISEEPVSFSFRLLESTTGAGAHFGSVLVRIENKNDKSAFLTTRIAEDEIIDGLARLTATPLEGEYIVNLTFRDEENTIAESTFDLKVLPKTQKKSFAVTDELVGFTLGALVFGFIIGRLLFRTKASK